MTHLHVNVLPCDGRVHGRIMVDGGWRGLRVQLADCARVVCLRRSSGENYDTIMYTLADPDKGGNAFSFFYFISFVVRHLHHSPAISAMPLITISLVHGFQSFGGVYHAF